MPFMTEPMPCSRTPKWSWRPPKGACAITGGVLRARVPVFPVRSAPPADEAGHDVERSRSSDLACTRCAGGELVAARPRRAASPPSRRARAARGTRRAASASSGSRVAERGAALLPRLARGAAARARPRGSTSSTSSGTKKSSSGGSPRISLTARDLVGAERVAVGLGGVGVLRRRLADVAAQHDQARAVGLGHARAEPGLERVEVVGDLAELARRASRRPRTASGRRRCSASSVGPSMVMWLSS